MSDKGEALYQGALQRWPQVQWDRQAFLRHLGDEHPEHGADLYLAGAAGHRISSAWHAIEVEIGPGARRVLERQPRADYQSDDLWSETIARTMEDDDSAA